MTTFLNHSHDQLGYPYINPYDTTPRWGQTTFFPKVEPIPPKAFKLGFMLGRFQHLHIGHEMVIKKAASVCDKLIVLIGSSQAKETLRNPFNIATRLDIMERVFGNSPNIYISHIPDMTHEDDHCEEWGRFVLEHVAKISNDKGIKVNPDLMIYGDDEERKSWFNPNDIQHVSQLVLTRGDIDISATKLREYLVKNNFWMWRQYANPNIHELFDELRNTLLQIDEYKERMV